MRSNTISCIQRLVVLLVLAVSLTATAFAHRLKAPQDDALALAAAYGATLEDFCGGDKDGSGGRAVHCMACQITGSVDLPSDLSTAITVPLIGFAPRLVFTVEIVALRQLDLSHAQQAPPVA